MPSSPPHDAAESIRILIFRMAGCCFGMDMEAVTGIRPLDFSEGIHMPISHFYEKIGMDTPKDAASDTPMMLMIADENRPWGMIIDGLEAVDVALSLDNIRPLPRLIRSAAPQLPFWGVGIRQSELILLVHFKEQETAF